MANIETGVDKLVRLVAKEKKVELSRAAAQLGVSTAVVQEWAEFLEEEGIVGLQYSLSKTFIVEKALSKTEVEKKGKEYEDKKEAFIRKVDAALKQLEDETAGFEGLKREYDTVKSNIGDRIEAVKEEIAQLKHYEELKRTIDHDILKQKSEYEKTLEDLRVRIAAEEKRYAKIVEEVGEEQKKLEREQTAFNGIKKEEEDLARRLEALQEAMGSVHARLNAESQAIATHEDRLSTLRELAEKLRTDLVEKRRKEIEPTLRISNDQSERILRIHGDVMRKIKEHAGTMEQFEAESREIARRFEEFFTKRTKTEETIKELDRLKAEMRDELNALIARAKAFDITSKGADINKHIKELEGEFRQFDQRRSAFGSKLEELKSIIMGRFPRKMPARQPARKASRASKAKKASGKRRKSEQP